MKIGVLDPSVAGVDEVGRGPLAGPVVAAAVCLDARVDWSGLRDSKRLSAARREAFDRQIRSQALAWSIGVASVEEIDALNIRRATHLAMQRAIHTLTPQPQSVLVDGNDPPALALPVTAIVGGDDQIPAIAAASIIAKVYRDGCLRQLHALYPQFGFDRHQGYPTAVHLQALAKHGPTPAHRRSFGPVSRAIQRHELPLEPGR